MNGNPGRPQKLTDDLKRWITRQQYERKKKLKAPVLQQELRVVIEKRVRQEVKERALTWSEKLILEEVEKRLPGVSAIQKYLRDIHPNPANELDNPWHLGATPNMSGEAVPAVLKVREHEADSGKFTIRQALWVGRLYRVITDITNLAFISSVYTLREKVCELSSTPFDTSDYDGLLNSPGQFMRHFFDDLLNLDPWVNLETFLAYIKAIGALKTQVKAASLLYPLREDIEKIIEETENGGEDSRALVRVLAEIDKVTGQNLNDRDEPTKRLYALAEEARKAAEGARKIEEQNQNGSEESEQ